MGGYVGFSPQDPEYRILDALRPVGSIWYCATSADPNTLFPGTWSQITEGTFLVAAGDGTNPDYDLGATGGEEAHQLTLAEMPSHTHGPLTGTSFLSYVGSGGSNLWPSSGATAAAAGGTNSRGSDVAHENRPPYLAVNVWVRMA